jgi:hypothetical protein
MEAGVSNFPGVCSSLVCFSIVIIFVAVLYSSACSIASLLVSNWIFVEQALYHRRIEISPDQYDQLVLEFAKPTIFIVESQPIFRSGQGSVEKLKLILIEKIGVNSLNNFFQIPAARNSQPYIQAAIGAAGHAIFPAAGLVSLGCVQYFSGLGQVGSFSLVDNTQRHI